MKINSDCFSADTDNRFTEEFDKLEDLAQQQYFELIQEKSEYRLVYMMNDAAESFLVFENCIMNGEYVSDSDEPFSIAVEQNGSGYLMIVHQGSSSVFTLSFTGFHSETHLFNYGATGHFWIKGHEKLRLIDYWLGIIREKFNILGSEFCNDTELLLADLSRFRPLRYYNSVPEKYMIPNDYIYETSPEAVSAFREISDAAGEKYFSDLSEKYTDRKLRRTASLLSGKKGIKITDFIISLIQVASSDYSSRSHAGKHTALMSEAAEYASHLSSEGMKTLVLREEPFEMTADTMNFSVTVFGEKKTLTGIKTITKTFSV